MNFLGNNLDSSGGSFTVGDGLVWAATALGANYLTRKSGGSSSDAKVVAGAVLAFGAADYLSGGDGITKTIGGWFDTEDDAIKTAERQLAALPDDATPEQRNAAMQNLLLSRSLSGGNSNVGLLGSVLQGGAAAYTANQQSKDAFKLAEQQNEWQRENTQDQLGWQRDASLQKKRDSLYQYKYGAAPSADMSDEDIEAANQQPAQKRVVGSRVRQDGTVDNATMRRQDVIHNKTQGVR